MSIEKIIVLEDDLIIRKHLEQQLRNRRYDVVISPVEKQCHHVLRTNSITCCCLP